MIHWIQLVLGQTLRVFRGTKFPNDFNRTYLVATIFAVVYFAAPIIIYKGKPKFEVYITDYGPAGETHWQPGNITSLVGPADSKMVVDGTRVIQSYGDDYKLVGAAFHHYRSVDPVDEPNISISGPYDVKQGEIFILIPWNEVFLNEMIVQNMHGTSYVLLLIPKDKPVIFKTIRQATDNGAIRLQDRGGPP